MVLSIVIPIFNEKNTILDILEKVERIDLKEIKKEIILVDDCSTDGTRDILKKLESKYKIIYQPKNQGKGAAIRAGFTHVTGDIILIQDADLEYNPENYPNLLRPILQDEADVVFGSRFLNPEYRHLSRLYHLANKVLTGFSNLLTGFHLTDMLTCHKAFKKEVIEQIGPYLTGNRFEIEPELTAFIAKKKYRICEVPLSFQGILRTAKEGKKVRAKDGLAALWYIMKFNLLR
ncbi:MAG: glycosyltransferase family 2 protein [Candidatus Nealsonbacteria bacterium]|nr:glycosyltransferase family 2 protein [Candidatus Nealsonbacteria bacterium]